ncbi:hypothetical protein AB1484_29800 [Parafrankia sp. FMc6]|uniref:hypothetical protein n=1 Tax=Parafrankia soli TaxID=2599596 RepID=UPI0034D50057
MNDSIASRGAVTAQGVRSIAVGGDAINSLFVTGDNNTFFVGDYARLQDVYLSPALLHQELELDRFIGREWLVELLDEAIARHDRGYVVLEADAGMGKSTFLAWLARERGYVHHFVRLMPDPSDISVALRNISAQLIRAWDLETFAVGGILPPAADRPDFLHDVLEAAAGQRDALRPGEPIVIVVDGVNETVPLAGQNPLGLPRSLPTGVHVVLSQRPVHIPLRITVPRVVIHIDPDSVDNRRDAREFLRARAASSVVRAVLERDGIMPEQFVDILLSKSEGVWVYLHYVIADIEAGRLSPSHIDRLPVGLWHYYGQYWRDWQRDHEDRWHDIDLPVLAVIAAAAEPLPARLIAELARTTRVTTVEDLLDNDWRPFLQIDESGEEVLYRAFHDSLGEFLHGTVDTSEMTAAERALCRRLAAATKAAHSQIADRYLTSWGGLEQGLQGLSDLQYDRIDDSYGFRHLADHLVGAGREIDLHTLLTLSRFEGTRRVNVWYAAHRASGAIAGYRRDVNLASALVRSGQDSTARALQIRYALMICSLNSVAEATPPALWSLLAKGRRLTFREAITQAREIPTAEDRAEALTSLIEVVPASLREEVESEAMSAVGAVPDEFWRVGELWRLYPLVAADRRGELLSIVRSLTDPFFQMMAARVLGTDEATQAESLRIGHGNEINPDSPSGLAASAELVEDYRRRRHEAAARLHQSGFSTVERAGQHDEEPAARYWRAHLLTLSAMESSAEDATRTADAARRVGEGIGDRREASHAWSALGVALAARAAADRSPVEALAAGIENPINRLSFVLALAVAARGGGGGGGPSNGAVDLSPDVVGLDTLSNSACGLAVSLLQGAVDDTARVTMLSEVAPTAACLDPNDVHTMVMTVGDLRNRTRVVLAVAERAAPADAQRLGRDVFEHLRANPDWLGWPSMVNRVARLLPADMVNEAIELSRGVGNHELRSSITSALGTRLSDLNNTTSARELLDSVSGHWLAQLQFALAKAYVRAAAHDTAVAVARSIPYVTWRVEILASVARTSPPEATEDLVAEIIRSVADLDPASSVSALARAATAAPPEVSSRLQIVGLDTAEGIGDYYERSMAFCSIVESLVTRGEFVRALELCVKINVEPLRAEALIATMSCPAARVNPTVIEYITQIGDAATRARVRTACLRPVLREALADAAGGGAALSNVFVGVLDDFSVGPRARLLESVPALLDVLVAVNGPAAVQRFAADLADIENWWP